MPQSKVMSRLEHPGEGKPQGDGFLGRQGQPRRQ